MLTKDELMAECHKIFNALPDRGETIDGVDDAVFKLNKQASQAIELATENEQLRAKLIRMLTKEQIDKLPTIDNDREKVELTFGDWFSVRDQAKQAIDFATENEQLRAEIAEYKETFGEQNRSLGDRIIECDQLRAKLDEVRDIASNPKTYVDAIDKIWQTLTIDKDGDAT